MSLRDKCAGCGKRYRKGARVVMANTHRSGLVEGLESAAETIHKRELLS